VPIACLIEGSVTVFQGDSRSLANMPGPGLQQSRLVRATAFPFGHEGPIPFARSSGSSQVRQTLGSPRRRRRPGAREWHLERDGRDGYVLSGGVQAALPGDDGPVAQH
jgi:hypothetical protein